MIVRKLLGIILLLFSFTVNANEVTEFLNKIDKLRECVPFSVTSWHRTPLRNAMIGGAKNSMHMKGLAVDIVLDNEEDEGFLEVRLKNLDLQYRNEGDHIHIQARRK